MDTYQEVSHQSFGSNLLQSIKFIAVGAVMFLASFALLYWNEGRADLSKVAKKSVILTPDGQNQAAGQGKLVSVTGNLAAEGEVGDPGYIKPAPHVMLQRTVEMFAWVEKKSTRTEKKTGGGSDTITTYTYEQAWTEKPQPSSGFKQPAGHDNPSMNKQSQGLFAKSASVGAYTFDPSAIWLPRPTPVALTAGTLEGEHNLSGDYILEGGTLTGPKVGDLRISYGAVQPNKLVTLLGQANGTTIGPYAISEKVKMFRAIDGTRDQAIATMHTEHTRITWFLRVAGLFLMWMGLMLVTGPIHTLLDVIPFIGKASRILVGIVLLPVAFVLTAVTVVISMIAHSWIALGVTVAVLAAGFILYTRSKAKKKEQEHLAAAA